MTKASGHIIQFIGLVLFQVLVLNNVNVNGLINPYIYPLFILLLPMEISGWVLLLLAFGTGLTIDVFSGTLGMHAFATVLMAALRPTVIDRISQRNQELTKSPSIQGQGFTWMLLYFVFLISIHNLVYFTIEYWSLMAMGKVLLKFALNSITSIFIIFLILYAFESSKKSST